MLLNSERPFVQPAGPQFERMQLQRMMPSRVEAVTFAMDEDTKYIIKSLTENLAAVTEKQAIILELLASKLPDISDAEKARLRESAKMNEENAKGWRQSLKNLG
jgi:hypothetical protein